MVAITDLHIYPVKSCAPIRLTQADLWETGLAFDRFWMLVDAGGTFMTQRSHPQMARIQPSLRFGQLRLQAPGMLALDVPIGDFDYAGAERLRTEVWRQPVECLVEPALVNQWFSTFLGQPCRLVRIDPDFRRICKPEVTGDDEAVTQFADGFPLLVISRASIDALNRRLEKVGEPPVDILRFRPNIVIDGIDAHEEDDIETLTHADYTLRLVQACERCPIPNLDVETLTFGTEPTRTLREYRLGPGGRNVIFGMNGIVIAGADTAVLRVGDELEPA